MADTHLPPPGRPRLPPRPAAPPVPEPEPWVRPWSPRAARADWDRGAPGRARAARLDALAARRAAAGLAPLGLTRGPS